MFVELILLGESPEGGVGDVGGVDLEEAAQGVAGVASSEAIGA